MLSRPRLLHFTPAVCLVRRKCVRPFLPPCCFALFIAGLRLGATRPEVRASVRMCTQHVLAAVRGGPVQPRARAARQGGCARARYMCFVFTRDLHGPEIFPLAACLQTLLLSYASICTCHSSNRVRCRSVVGCWRHRLCLCLCSPAVYLPLAEQAAQPLRRYEGGCRDSVMPPDHPAPASLCVCVVVLFRVSVVHHLLIFVSSRQL